MKKALGITALLAAALATTAAAGPYDSYGYYRYITVNTTNTGGGANVTADNDNYPLLVRFTNASDAAGKQTLDSSKSSGVDIVFTDSTGNTPLSFSRERFTASAAEFWVKVPKVVANSNTRIRAYWSKSSATELASDSAVFDTANGWRAVWHMNQSTTAVGVDKVLDATAWHNDGTLQSVAGQGATAPGDTTALIGVGKNFRGTNAGTVATSTGFYYQVGGTGGPASLNLNTTNGPYTVSAWVIPAYCNGTGRLAVISKYSNANGNDSARGWVIQVGNNADWRLSNAPKSLQTASTATISADFFQPGTCTAGGVTYLSGSYAFTGSPVAGTSAGVKLWVNDTASTNALAFGAAQGSSIGDKANVYIGRINNADRHMRGGVDEVRIHRDTLTIAWKKLDYRTQHPTQTAVTLDTAVANQIVSIAPARAAASPAYVAVRTAGKTVSFNVSNSIPTAVVADMSLVNARGSMVWNRTADLKTGAVQQWNGAKAASGVYMLRVQFKDASGAVLHSMTQQVPFNK